WDMFFRARGETRPYLAIAVVAEAWVFVVLLPASVIWGLTGAGWAVLSLGALSVIARQVPLRRLFPGLNLVANAWRERLSTGAAATDGSASPDEPFLATDEEPPPSAGTRGRKAARGPGLRLRESLRLPGAYPLWLTDGGQGRLWVTLRDSSSLALLDAAGRWH